jgi:hypothetical protein
MKVDMKNRFVIFFIVLTVLIVFARFGTRMTTYRTGWELGTECLALRGNPDKFQAFDPATNIQWDFDDWKYGYPDVKATVSDVREETPKMAYEALQKDYDQFKYIVEYHEYLFDVQIRTIADVELVDTTISNSYKHETSMPYMWHENFGQTGGDLIGKNLDGGVYVRFSCLPWGIPNFGDTPENYSFNGYWLGIMNAKVENIQTGIATQDIEITHTGWVRNVESVGSQLNMSRDDGTFTQSYSEISWDINKVLDPDIKNTVIVYLPFDLMAGAYEKFDPYAGWLLAGSITELKPVDYYVTYTVRMECLVVKEYEYRDPASSPNPSPIQKPQDYVPYTQLSFWDKYGLYIIIGIILLFLLGFIVLPILGISIGIFGLGRSRMVFRQTPFQGGYG